MLALLFALDLYWWIDTIYFSHCEEAEYCPTHNPGPPPREYPYERYHSKKLPVLSRWLRGNMHWAIKSLGKPKGCKFIMVSFTVPPWMWRWTLPRSKKMFPCPLGFVFYLLHISLYKLLLAIVLVLVVNHEIFQGKPGAWQHRAQTHWSSSAGLVSTVSYTTAACSSIRVLWLIRKFFLRREKRGEETLFRIESLAQTQC